VSDRGLPDDLNYPEFRRRQNAIPEPTGEREFRCPRCQARCTRLTDGNREAGHDPSCPRSMRHGGQPARADGGEEVRSRRVDC